MLIFKWKDSDKEVKIRFGACIVGLQYKGKRPDLVLVDKQELEACKATDSMGTVNKYLALLAKTVYKPGQPGELRII
jgi:hypothetical protein